MGTLQTWRKAYGAIKDHTKVGLAHVNSDFKDVDVAIVKATNHVECPPKERHIRKILFATSAIRPRADVAYCIRALARRLAKTRNWTVALKTLIVIHRTLREGGPAFPEELLNFQQRGCFLQMSNFKDDSSPIAWDCSGWVRTYALFLEERLECFKILKYDVEAERLPKPSNGQAKGYSRTRDLLSEELLEHLPALQQLLYRLIGCRPEGAASNNYVIQSALALVLKESFKIYCSVNDGIINLVDKFFEMPKHEAMKALDIYRRAGQQALNLSDFYETCKGLQLARNFQFPTLKEPPQSFLVTMEEYIREAPRIVSVPIIVDDDAGERLMLLTYKSEDVPEPDPSPPREEVSISSADLSFGSPPPRGRINNAFSAADDLLVLDIEEGTNSPGTADPSSNCSGFDPNGGWELALVSSSSSVLGERQQQPLDSVTLDSLYDAGVHQNSNPFAAVVYQLPRRPPRNPFGDAEPVWASLNPFGLLL